MLTQRYSDSRELLEETVFLEYIYLYTTQYGGSLTRPVRRTRASPLSSPLRYKLINT
jgi:hypothetical protein